MKEYALYLVTYKNGLKTILSIESGRRIVIPDYENAIKLEYVSDWADVQDLIDRGAKVWISCPMCGSIAKPIGEDNYFCLDCDWDDLDSEFDTDQS